MKEFAYRMCLNIVALLPRRTAQWVGRQIGKLVYRLNTRSVKVTRTNVTLCCPDEDAETLTRASLIETSQTVMETPAVWLADRDRVDKWIGEVHGEELLREAIDADSGLLLLLPHLGNWEVFNVFYRRYGTMTALYQPPDDEAMQALMEIVRAKNGNEMVPTTRAGITRLFRVLKEGGTVVVLPDQVPASGRYHPFFGQQALTDELGHRLLAKTGAAALGICFIRTPAGLFDVHILRPDEKIHGETDESLDAINRLMETCARKALPQYQWEYKRFRERPQGEKKLYRYGKPETTH